jgi:hypothetical protein
VTNAAEGSARLVSVVANAAEGSAGLVSVVANAAEGSARESLVEGQEILKPLRLEGAFNYFLKKDLVSMWDLGLELRVNTCYFEYSNQSYSVCSRSLACFVR